MAANKPMRDVPDFYGVGSLLIYLTLSVLFFGRSLFGHLSDRYIGASPDPSQFMWYMRWWPYALAHHLNPFIPRIIWAPSGVNIAWAASISLPSLIAYPLTAAVGLIPAYNLLSLLCPALAGWSAFLLCRLITRAYWPSVFGGFIFAFSAHMAGKTFGNLNDALVFPVPLAVYLALLYLNERIKARTFVILFAFLLVAQFLFFIELFATMTLVSAIALLTALWVFPIETKRRLTAMFAPVVTSYVIAVAVLSPYLYFLLAYRPHQTEIMPASTFSIDLLNFFVPTPLNELGKFVPLTHITSTFQCGVLESGGYVAIPLIAMAVLFVRHHWRESHCRLMIDLLLVLLVFSLGPFLQVMGHITAVGLPWLLFTKLPFIQKALPARFMLYVFLDLAVIASLWLSELDVRPAAKVVSATLTVLFMLPNLSASYWTTEANIPKFFSTGLYKRYLSPGENVIIMPYGICGDTMLWQAESNMYFNMVEGWTGFPLTPKEFENWPILAGFFSMADLPNASLQFKAFVAHYSVNTIIVAENCFCVWQLRRVKRGPSGWRRAAVSARDAALWHDWFSTLGVTPVTTGGVQLYSVPLGQLTAYKHLDPIELSSIDARCRFDTLLSAAARYLRDGHDLFQLGPVVAKNLSLIPQQWFGEFSNLPHPEKSHLVDGMVLGRDDDGNIAVGVIGYYQALRHLIDKYGRNATKVRLISTDSPPQLLEKPTQEVPLILVITFDRATLEREAVPMETSHQGAALSLDLDSPPCPSALEAGSGREKGASVSAVSGIF